MAYQEIDTSTPLDDFPDIHNANAAAITQHQIGSTPGIADAVGALWVDTSEYPALAGYPIKARTNNAFVFMGRLVNKTSGPEYLNSLVYPRALHVVTAGEDFTTNASVFLKAEIVTDSDSAAVLMANAEYIKIVNSGDSSLAQLLVDTPDVSSAAVNLFYLQSYTRGRVTDTPVGSTETVTDGEKTITFTETLEFAEDQVVSITKVKDGNWQHGDDIQIEYTSSTSFTVYIYSAQGVKVTGTRTISWSAIGAIVT